MIFETDSSSDCLSYIISSFPKLQTLPFQTVHFLPSDWQSLYVCIDVCKYWEHMQHLFLEVIQEKATKHHFYLNYSASWFHFIAFLESMLVLLKSDASYYVTQWNFDLP